MWLYALRRLVLTIPILFGVTVICFALVHIAPGDPIQNLLSPTASAADAARLRAAYGLDQPIPIQYLIWIGKVFVGDLGQSIANNSPVSGEVVRAFFNTLTIALISVVLAFILSMVLGVIAAYKAGTWVDKLITAVAVFGISVPTFWLGVVLVILFAVNLFWLPATGMGASGSENFSYLRWADFKFAIMPIIALALPPLGIMTRTTRSSLAEILNQDFIQTLRAKGMSEFQIMRHAVRNIMPQAVAMLGLQLGYLIGGSVLVETVFTWPGTGFLLNKAILTRDIPLLQGTILVLATAFVLINLVVDLAQSVIDPRIKRS
ncbi:MULTISPECIES: ABC transporter permease [Rhizobium]|uniref:ABC transporter permease n=1 Tax=Rhizobium rhododendri TaxID=2506430 RepID=A0ABY8IR93_9HYPH|nr:MULTISPECIES: ABC transporter permease [Rhizobium]MBO9101688.1 ABC transporter permease [Rhizobium sp. L58/93]MBO9187744.1 ABC transporter permease [Rhizobium sp. E27B/91]QXZ86365.1 ABC transporter permease [Rhizobium sp. K1/93]QXZ92180.1 ABC transporter permease [Rhizobium sp. K15/93]WFS25995.1 ABC transporter permease [Rhizobium rhododendri]